MSKENKSIIKGRPWDAPVREYVKHFPMMISVYDGDKLVKEQEIDYGKYEDRRFLGKLTYWALTEGYTVETSKAD